MNISSSLQQHSTNQMSLGNSPQSQLRIEYQPDSTTSEYNDASFRYIYDDIDDDINYSKKKLKTCT